MRRFVISLGLLLLAGVFPVSATCSDNVFPIFQCGFTSWFEPPPPDAGAVSAVWWQLGFGNNNVNGECCTSNPQEGTGIFGLVFNGNDSGVAGMVLTPAEAVLPQHASLIPDGSLCSDYQNSWGAFGVNGCPDNRPTSSGLHDDNYLNPYWSTQYGPCPYDDCPYETTNYLVDQPIAVLARGSSNRYFALAFVSSLERQGDSTQANEGVFSLGQVRNGNPNPVTGQNNIIPWQPVPRPRLVSFTVPDPNTRVVTLSWSTIRFVHDESLMMRSPGILPEYPNVGVLNHLSDPGGLCRFVLQWATDPSGAGNPDPGSLTWNTAETLPCPLTGMVSATLTLPRLPNNLVRVRTVLGKTPRTTSTTLANARLGLSGDLGFEATDCRADNCVNSPPFLIVWSPLVSEQAVDMRAIRDKGLVRVSFRTTAELSVESIAILGKGDAVVAVIPCKQCRTGVGDSYEVALTAGQLKGARELKVLLNGPGGLSAPFPVE